MMRKLMYPTVITVFVLCGAVAAVAQPSQSPMEPEVAPEGEDFVELQTMDAAVTRGELIDLLRRHPSELGLILKLDPTLLSNAGYLGTYPALEAFVGAHPEVAHNPNYFLAHVRNPMDRRLQGLLEVVVGFAAAALAAFVLAWLIRTLIEQRRWRHLARVQTEVHTKLLDRFSSNEELLAYIETSAGRRFLESAPIPVQAGAVAVGAPFGRILWSAQLGVVVAAGAAGLLLVSSWFDEEVAQALAAMGAIGLFVGIGFLLSGVASLILSRRLGLWRAGGDAAQAELGESASASLQKPAL